MANVIKVPAKTRTEVVVVEPEKYVLEMNEREARIVRTLLAHTKGTDPNFPEVMALSQALADAGVSYWGKMTVDRTTSRVISLVEVAPAQRAFGSSSVDEEWN